MRRVPPTSEPSPRFPDSDTDKELLQKYISQAQNLLNQFNRGKITTSALIKKLHALVDNNYHLSVSVKDNIPRRGGEIANAMDANTNYLRIAMRELEDDPPQVYEAKSSISFYIDGSLETLEQFP